MTERIPYNGANTVTPGIINKNGIPKVSQSFFGEMPICRSNTNVISMSIVINSANNKLHKQLPQPGG